MFDTKKVADTYDQIALNFSATRGKLSPEVISLLPALPKGATVLDLGCGNGVLLTALPEDISYTGIDISPTLLKEASRSHPVAHPVARFILSDISVDSTWERLDLFDFIAALAVFHHLPTSDDHIKLLLYIKQHLKPTGSVLVSVWRLTQSRFDKYRTDSKHLSIPFHNGPARDFFAFTDDELPKLAKQVGFGNIKTKIVKDNLYLSLSL